MQRTVLIMAGRNRFGRQLLMTLLRHGLAPWGVVLETETKRSSQMEAWLAHPAYEPPAFEDLVAAARLSVFTTQDVRSEQACDWVRSSGADLVIKGGAGVFPKELLEAPRVGVLNAHPGLLPAYRGLDPVLWTLSEGGTLGATVHFMDEGLDTGDILVAQPLPNDVLSLPQTLSSLTALRVACMQHGANLLVRYLDNPEAFPRTPQDETKARYFGRFPESRVGDVNSALRDLMTAHPTAIAKDSHE
jgi:methionyl-tRNA formyltransferase